MCSEASFMYDYTIMGQGWNFEEPLSLFSWHRKFTFYQDYIFCQWERKQLHSSMWPVKNYNSDNLHSRTECHVVLKGFLISKNTAAINVLLMKFWVMWSASLIRWSVVLWSTWKPKGLALSKFLSSVCFLILFKVSFSNSLCVMGKELNRHKLWGNLRSLPGFSRIMSFASFQGAMKWPSLRQWLNKCVKHTRDLLGIC